MSTSWKTGTVFFGLGVISTGLYALGSHVGGALLWGATVAYLAYLYYESKHPS